MKISNDTIAVLKNFASVNTNILIREGNTLSTISTGKNIFARATVAEKFDREFAIYDLNNLLGLFTLMDDTEVDFGDESLSVSKDQGIFEYYYADKSIVVAAPDKQIEVDDYFTFVLPSETIERVIRAASIAAAPMLSIISDGTDVYITASDPSTPKSNNFKQKIAKSDKKFTAHLAIENFKVILGDDYTVTISEKKFMHLSNNAKDVKYWLALDKTSEIS
tara:strand:+ start:6394 stop:7056 length:663 start_codon:yes stop_codon:yes gene_type:complete